MNPIPLHPNLPTPTTTFGNPVPIAQYYVCPHCNNQSPLVRAWVGLTDDELESMAEQYVTDCYFDTLKYGQAIQSKLKEKNA